MKTHTTRHSGRPIFTAGLSWTIFGVCLASLLPLAAQATCQRWDASGNWSAVQSNGAKPVFTLQQTGAELYGSAYYSYIHKSECVLAFCGDDAYLVEGSVDGAIDGNGIDITVYWNNGTVGEYTGKINSHGRIEGTTYDRQHPQTMASWYSAQTLSCPSDEAGSPPAIAPSAIDKPPVALGRVYATPTNPLTRLKATPLRPGLRAPASAVVAVPQSRAAPVLAPNDLLIGSVRFSQNNQPIKEVVLGTPVAIDCDYAVNVTGNAFSPHIRSWAGTVQIGGVAPLNLPFQGSIDAGPHVAQVLWTPATAGQVPVSCSINSEFAYAEADPGNNRKDAIVLVVNGAAGAGQ